MGLARNFSYYKWILLVFPYFCSNNQTEMHYIDMNIQTILANLKIEALNEMQQASMKAYRDGNDLILLSPTGSGKTLADRKSVV